MPSILTVCSGNVCRSPLAALTMAARLKPWEVSVPSAGTHAAVGRAITPETARIAADWGVAEPAASAHLARSLTERDILDADLILAMTSAHRRVIADLAPQRQRSTFTLREFARIADTMSDEELVPAADRHGSRSQRVRAMAAAVAHRRGFSQRPAQPSDDDVDDPYGGTWSDYLHSAEQMRPALEVVVRAVTLALR